MKRLILLILCLFLLYPHPLPPRAEENVDGELVGGTQASGDVTANAGNFANDNRVLTVDGADSKNAQQSVAVLTDAGALSGLISVATTQSATSASYWEAVEDSSNGTNKVTVHGENNQANTHLLSLPDSGEYTATEVVGINYPFRECVTIDPVTHYDFDTQVWLFEVGDEAPNGIIIDEWKLTCDADPDPSELDIDLKRATDWDYTGAAVMDICDTTAGASSEDTDANINSGSAVANGAEVYLEFGADPDQATTDCGQMIFCLWWHPVGAAK